MTPFRHRLTNYIEIPPRGIQAADRKVFQAIGKGDLHISFPHGKQTTRVLARDVLYAPNLGGTLLSVGCITAAGYGLHFRGQECRI
ncbi:hypothetical protein C8J57DRAFT_1606065, partial [Mycena rebaudengoi]